MEHFPQNLCNVCIIFQTLQSKMILNLRGNIWYNKNKQTKTHANLSKIGVVKMVSPHVNSSREW